MLKQYSLRDLMFLVICSDLGLFAKRLIGPGANMITDFLHIPGGISTGFSLMFLVIAAVLCNKRGAAVLMSLVQCVTAFALGMVGNMGLLSPIGYVVPGIVIELMLFLFRKAAFSMPEKLALTNACAGAAAALTADIIVFRLPLIPMLLHLSVGVASGILFGLLASRVVQRIRILLRLPGE